MKVAHAAVGGVGRAALIMAFVAPCSEAGARHPGGHQPETFVHEAQLTGHADPIDHVPVGQGLSVAIEGDTAVVGSLELLAGVAHVFVRAGTTWTLQQALIPSDAPISLFGSAVAISGDTVVVGAVGADTAGGTDAGAAYVFVRSGTTWTEQQKLTPADPGPIQAFGISVSVNGDRAAVGALRADAPGAPGAGAAYVFARVGSAWVQQQKVTAQDASPGDSFGRPVVIQGNTLLVGASDDDTAAGDHAGSAYVFVRPGTIWLQEQQLAPSDAAAGDLFGFSASLSGDTTVVGATGKDGHTGSAYVFVRSGTTWTEEQRIDASDGDIEDHFGTAVSLQGDTLVVGAVNDDDGGTDAGASYVFTRSGTTWTEEQKVAGSAITTGSGFGRGSALDGDTLVVGAPSSLSGPDGQAYVFVGSGSSWSEQQQLVPPDSGAGDQFGDRVSMSADTLLIGAPYDDMAGGGDAGAAYVFVRSGASWAEEQKLAASDAAPDTYLGRSVSLSGETAIVGGTFAAYVFVRTAGVWTEQQKLVKPGGNPGDFFGWSVALDGDTAVVSAPYTGTSYVFVRQGTVWSLQQELPGTGSPFSISGDTIVTGGSFAVDVYVRSGVTWTLQQTLLPPICCPHFFGLSVALSGDTLAVGGDGGSQLEPGSVFVFVRSGTVWTHQQRLFASDGVLLDAFGRSVFLSGDVLAVGSSKEELDSPAGSAYVFTRSGSTWTEQQKLVAPDSSARDGFGKAVSLSADRLAVGAPLDSTSAGGVAGSAHVFRFVGVGTADLAVTKTDGQTVAPVGQPLTYTILVSNAGTDTVTLAQVSDPVPPELQAASWTCTASPGASCPAFGTGSISALVGIPAGGSVTFSLTATLDPGASGVLVNTASVAVPAGFVDPVPANDSATDSDTIVEAIDLSVGNTDGQTVAVPGQMLTYTVTVANAGPSDAFGAALSDTLPPALIGVHWTCTASAGSSCTPVGTGSISDVVSVLAGGQATYSITGQVDPAASGSLVNAASVTPPAGPLDVDPGNDAATDTDAILPTGFTADGELAHGDSARHDLATLPGPVADEDLFRILQRPHASYEVLLDGASGDLGSGSGPLLELLGSDGASVVQGSSPAGAGGSRSLRWINAGDQPVADQFVRVRSAGCTTDCDASDVYRLTVKETTSLVPRFNNAGSQVTVLLVNNLGDASVSLDIQLRSESGAPLVGISTPLGARQIYVLDTSTVAPGVGGSISVAHTGRQGQIGGKAVAIEPATGFTFETALQTRPR